MIGIGMNIDYWVESSIFMEMSEPYKDHRSSDVIFIVHKRGVTRFSNYYKSTSRKKLFGVPETWTYYNNPISLCMDFLSGKHTKREEYINRQLRDSYMQSQLTTQFTTLFRELILTNQITRDNI